MFNSCIYISELGYRPPGNSTKAKVGKKFRLVEVKAYLETNRPHYFFIQEWVHSRWHDAQDIAYTNEEEAFVALGRFIEASPNFGKHK